MRRSIHCLAIGWILLVTHGAVGQQGVSSLRFAEDQRFRHVFNVGRDCIQDKEWKQACEALQAILSEKNHPLVRVFERDPADPKKEVARWVGIKHEANHLLGSMPAEGLEVYEEMYGKQAKEQLDAAQKKNDDAMIFDVAQRFRHTKAGKAAFEIVLKKRPELKANAAVEVKEWRSWRGNATNSAQTTGAAPKLDAKVWSRPLFMDKFEGVIERDPDDEAFARVDAAIKKSIELKRAVLPGTFPVVAKDIVVYRTARDVRALSLKELKVIAEPNAVFVLKPGQILWRSIAHNRSLALLMEKPQYRAEISRWLAPFEKVPGFTSFLYENTLLGSLSADDRHVYAINDLAVPPHPSAFEPLRENPFAAPRLKPYVVQNELFAYSVFNGKLIWDLNAEDLEFKNSHFISLPINIGGKIYLLNERLIDPNAKPGAAGKAITSDSELRLVCLDPNKMDFVNFNPKPTMIGAPHVLAKIASEDSFVREIRRRIHAAPLAYDDGVLVCPTNAGDVIGVDLLTRTLAWSYPYRESPREPLVLPEMPQAGPMPVKGTTVLAKWKAAPPAIQAGKIVFTAPDADSIHCINLRDGKLIWKKSQAQGDQYFAGVFDGKVLIVGDARVRALNLKDGNELWSIATSEPSGQGVAGKGIYYLPLRKNEIVAIDIGKGQIRALYRGNDKDAAPGNLVFYQDALLSQSATEIRAYPLVKP